MNECRIVANVATVCVCVFLWYYHSYLGECLENSDGLELNTTQGPDVRSHMTEDLLDGKRYFICNFCGKTCPLKATIIRHIKTVHAESYQLKCDVCGRTYKNEPSFQDHLRRKRCDALKQNL